jgi:hypothetical protein
MLTQKRKMSRRGKEKGERRGERRKRRSRDEEDKTSCLDKFEFELKRDESTCVSITGCEHHRM